MVAFDLKGDPYNLYCGLRRLENRAVKNTHNYLSSQITAEEYNNELRLITKHLYTWIPGQFFADCAQISGERSGNALLIYKSSAEDIAKYKKVELPTDKHGRGILAPKF